MFGLLNVNKPVDLTSHDVVARVRRMLPRGVKVGHSGTLDPFATGVLVLGIGPATRLADYVAAQPKQYVAEITLGATSTTDDTEGERTDTHQPIPSVEAVGRACEPFIGEIDQTPPAFSAVHVDGQRAYKLARNKTEFELPPRKVTIYRIELLSLLGRVATLRIDCGRGVYIRSIARDLGRALGCGGYCSALTRTRVGAFTLDNSAPLAELCAESVAERLLPARLAVADWPSCTLAPDQQAEIRQGKFVAAAPTGPGEHIAALDEAGQLIALCRLDQATGRLRPTKVFATESG